MTRWTRRTRWSPWARFRWSGVCRARRFGPLWAVQEAHAAAPFRSRGFCRGRGDDVARNLGGLVRAEPAGLVPCGRCRKCAPPSVKFARRGDAALRYSSGGGDARRARRSGPLRAAQEARPTAPSFYRCSPATVPVPVPSPQFSQLPFFSSDAAPLAPRQFPSPPASRPPAPTPVAPAVRSAQTQPG